MTALVIALLIAALLLASLFVEPSDLDDRDRRGWWPGERAR